MDESSDKAEIVGDIHRMTGRVPPRVMAGSYQLAVQWKRIAESARKAADSRRTKIESLMELRNSLRSFEQ